MIRDVAQRLEEHIKSATGQKVDLSIGVIGDASTVTTRPSSPAIQAAVSSFDWADAAHDAWDDNRQPERKAFKQTAVQSIADNDAFLADPTITNPELIAQVKRLTQQNTRLIKLAMKG